MGFHFKARTVELNFVRSDHELPHPEANPVRGDEPKQLSVGVYRAEGKNAAWSPDKSELAADAMRA